MSHSAAEDHRFPAAYERLCGYCGHLHGTAVAPRANVRTPAQAQTILRHRSPLNKCKHCGSTCIVIRKSLATASLH